MYYTLNSLMHINLYHCTEYGAKKVAQNLPALKHQRLVREALGHIPGEAGEGGVHSRASGEVGIEGGLVGGGVDRVVHQLVQEAITILQPQLIPSL